RPHLLAADDPVVAVGYGPGGQPRQVRSGPGLAEELAGDQVAPEEGGHDPGDEFRRRVAPQDRGEHPVQLEEVRGRGLELALHLQVGRAVSRRQFLAAQLGGTVDPGQPSVEQPGPEGPRRRQGVPLRLGIRFLPQRKVLADGALARTGAAPGYRGRREKLPHTGLERRELVRHLSITPLPDTTITVTHY